nr:sigma 54-interacting transcriptional regulator [Pleionea sp. CnH1-48]
MESNAVVEPVCLKDIFPHQEGTLLTLIRAGYGQHTLIFGDKTLLVELFPLEQQEGIEPVGRAGAVVIFREPVQVAQQIERWQRSKNIGFEQVVAVSDAMTNVLEQAKQIGQLDAPLLIEGETGVGKELIARCCHHLRSKDKPFMALNCAALPDNAAEHELFGYASGAFEGAVEGGKPGLLELAHGGTLCFDEIGEMSPYLQVKLLRFLEEGAFRRVGTNDEVRVNVRVVATTQKDLRSLCEQQLFREDLFYRLNVLNLQVPPLRRRKNDIEPLAEYFIDMACQRLQKPLCSLTVRARQALRRYNWPGNVRELENTIFRAVSMTTSEQITTRLLHMPMMQVMDDELDDLEQVTLHQAIHQFEKRLLEHLYPLYPSSRKLGQRLGISHTAVAKKLKQFGIKD